MYEAIRNTDTIGVYENLESALFAIDKDAQRCFCYLSSAKPVTVDGKVVKYEFLDMNSHPAIWEILVR